MVGGGRGEGGGGRGRLCNMLSYIMQTCQCTVCDREMRREGMCAAGEIRVALYECTAK